MRWIFGDGFSGQNDRLVSRGRTVRSLERSVRGRSDVRRVRTAAGRSFRSRSVRSGRSRVELRGLPPGWQTSIPACAHRGARGGGGGRASRRDLRGTHPGAGRLPALRLRLPMLLAVAILPPLARQRFRWQLGFGSELGLIALRRGRLVGTSSTSSESSNSMKVGDVQESVALQANIHKSRLHSGKDAGDAAFVDGTCQGVFVFAFEVNFSEQIVFDQPHFGFVRAWKTHTIL